MDINRHFLFLHHDLCFQGHLGLPGTIGAIKKKSHQNQLEFWGIPNENGYVIPTPLT